MNQRIQLLADHAKAYANQCTKDIDGDVSWHWMDYYTEKFAELVVQECASIADKAEPYKSNDLMLKHFGIEKSRTQPDQEAAAFIAAENKKVASRYGYFPKLHPSEWKD